MFSVMTVKEVYNAVCFCVSSGSDEYLALQLDYVSHVIIGIVPTGDVASIQPGLVKRRI